MMGWEWYKIDKLQHPFQAEFAMFFSILGREGVPLHIFLPPNFIKPILGLKRSQGIGNSQDINTSYVHNLIKPLF